jgi:hypothetical protein
VFLGFVLDVDDIHDLQELLAQQLTLPLVAPYCYRHLAQLFTLVRSDMQAVDVVRPCCKDTHNLEQRSMSVLD